MTLQPMTPPRHEVAEIVRRDIERAGGVDKLTEKNSAAFKILRGNYDAAMETAYARVYRWKVSQGVNPARMDARKANLDGPRAALHAMAWKAFQQWAGDVEAIRLDRNSQTPVSWKADSPDFIRHPIGLYPALYQALPESTHMEQGAGSATGVGTSGGYNNDSTLRKRGAEALNVAVLAATAGAVFGFSRVWGPPGEGGAVADKVNDAAFLVRSLLSMGRVSYTEDLRLQWEAIFEQGNVTREGLDQYVSRLFNASSALDITMAQRLNIAAATEQFWANYLYLSNKPINHAEGWTHEQRELAILAKVGAYQGAMSRMLHLQDSAIDATDARRFEGRGLRFGALTTYGINVAHALQWFANRDLNASAKIPAEACFYVLFGLGNSLNAVKEARSLAGGFFGITDTETDKFAQSLQLAGMGALMAGGVPWAVSSLISAATSKVPAEIGVDVLNMFFEGAFTFAMSKNFQTEYARFNADAMPGPRAQAIPQLLVQGFLLLIMIVALGAGGVGTETAGGSGAGA